jgi:cupredoxin-like protein
LPVTGSLKDKKMKTKFSRGRPIAALLLAAIAILFSGTGSRAQEAAAVAISVKNHQFQPAEIHAPANKPLAIRVKNLDAMPMEFESVSLRVEKVIVAGGEGVVNVRPLAPGRYEFFDDFHQQTRGFLVVQ